MLKREDEVEKIVEIDEQGNVSNIAGIPRSSIKSPRIKRPGNGGVVEISIGDIFSLLQVVCTALGGAKIIIELAKLWVEDRKGRKVILKKGDVEVEIQGGVSYEELEEKLELFRNLSKENKTDEVKIIVP